MDGLRVEKLASVGAQQLEGALVELKHKVQTLAPHAATLLHVEEFMHTCQLGQDVFTAISTLLGNFAVLLISIEIEGDHCIISISMSCNLFDSE